ncbi:hypothetical protein A9259_01065 [Vibrio cyclitrophicus]|uniref:hypothetical protein n=1 Tax=Vibrio cyclitrophicus TaxID=47951 RepID=UPI0007EEA663|nr:hypothetical protein [Vibrio cyclitrophicus]OBT02932.1 hypothetical protein A9259_01065 [Vibrio cyclitrophicus]
METIVNINGSDFDTTYYAAKIRMAECHFYFIQGAQAAHNELYLPAVVSFLNGIESTLRVIIKNLESPLTYAEPSAYKCLSNNLLLNARDVGLDVVKLAFDGESNFITRLESQKPNFEMVELVRIRNNLCHGNVFEYVNQEFMIFTPECIRELCSQLFDISIRWSDEVERFRNR